MGARQVIADNGVIDRDRMALPGPITTLPHYTTWSLVVGGGEGHTAQQIHLTPHWTLSRIFALQV